MAGQGGEWVVTPARPTAGDTIWLQRFVATPPGWQVRAQKLEPEPGAAAPVELLAEPTVRRVAGGWLVRYPIVAWAPAVSWAAPPPILRVAPTGHEDSLPRDTAWFRVWSVLPGAAGLPEPQPALALLVGPWRRPLWPLASVLASMGLLAALVRLRRRPPRQLPPTPQVPVEPEVPDERWLAAGEPKAVAARATHRLRAAIARAVPEAHEALSAAECLAALERARTQGMVRETGEVLAALDQVAFASVHGTDVVGLAARARLLASGFGA